MNDFFFRSDLLDHMVLRPLSHIKANWELTWDGGTHECIPEEDSFCASLNQLITELDQTSPPSRYHDNEDCLAQYVLNTMKWPIKKVGSRWIGAEYESILEQGGFEDLDEKNLILAAAGRIAAAKKRGQCHYDDMEESHRKMLAAVLSIILYHRASYE